MRVIGPEISHDIIYFTQCIFKIAAMLEISQFQLVAGMGILKI